MAYKTYATKSVKYCYPAAERNKEPILQTLKSYIDKTKASSLLEISSGSGQHVAHLAPNYPNVTFQPTEFDQSLFASINAHAKDSGGRNVNEVQYLDVREHPSKWLQGKLIRESMDYMLCVNLIHISEWTCAEGLFKGASYALKPGGFLFTYGPYSVNGTITPDSNVRFDASLRSQNPAWGLRDIYKELSPLATQVGIHLKHLHDLPANNKLLVWEKTN